MTDADEILTTQRFSARPMLSIDAADLRRLLDDLSRLREQRDELQASNTHERLKVRDYDWTAQLRHMFATFGQAMPDRPGFPDSATVKLRRKLLIEETQETLDALADGDLVEVADGCIDVCVVALGMLVAFGIDPRPLWAEVMATNLAKAGGPKSADGKVMKAPGWQPPRIAELLKAQGWTPPKEAA